MAKSTIISAYSVHPDQKSSEAIVNTNWLDVYSSTRKDIYLLSSFNNYRYISGKRQLQKKLRLITFLYKQSKGVGKFFYSLSNKIYRILSGSKYSLQIALWINKETRVLDTLLKDGDVVWSRILPVVSLQPILNVFKIKAFPFIVNVNDPINPSVFDKNNLNAEQLTFLETKNIAQAWTFPSSKLADRMADNYDLDRKRCFVIPHAMRQVEDLYIRNLKKKSINILYTGTFYKSAFTEDFKNSLIAFCKLEQIVNVNFIFVLSQYDEASISWLKTSIPNVTLKFKLDRTEVLKLVKQADCMFVVDSILHTELLKGKLIEAIAFGIPVFAITYKKSIMDKVVVAYGSVSAYQDTKDDILNKLNLFISQINDLQWLNTFYKERRTVLNLISEDYITQATKQVNEFALGRFRVNELEQNDVVAPNHLNWP